VGSPPRHSTFVEMIGFRRNAACCTGSTVGANAIMAATNKYLARINKSYMRLTRPTSEEPYRQCRPPMHLEFIFMKPSALLAVALVAFGVWAWHVVPDYVSSRSPSPRAAATGSACRCQGCGCKGGPGWRGQNGQCVSHADLTKDCGSPPSTRCTYEGARQVCPSRG
jgi:hypothetical protein